MPPLPFHLLLWWLLTNTSRMHVAYTASSCDIHTCTQTHIHAHSPLLDGAEQQHVGCQEPPESAPLELQVRCDGGPTPLSSRRARLRACVCVCGVYHFPIAAVLSCRSLQVPPSATSTSPPALRTSAITPFSSLSLPRFLADHLPPLVVAPLLLLLLRSSPGIAHFTTPPPPSTCVPIPRSRDWRVRRDRSHTWRCRRSLFSFAHPLRGGAPRCLSAVDNWCVVRTLHACSVFYTSIPVHAPLSHLTTSTAVPRFPRALALAQFPLAARSVAGGGDAASPRRAHRRWCALVLPFSLLLSLLEKPCRSVRAARSVVRRFADSLPRPLPGAATPLSTHAAIQTNRLLHRQTHAIARRLRTGRCDSPCTPSTPRVARLLCTFERL